MDNTLPLWVAILISLMTAIGGGFGVWILNIFKQRKELKVQEQDAESKRKIAENEQAVTFYRDIIASLKEDILKITKHQDALEEEHIKCREAAIKMGIEMDLLRKEVETLLKEIASLKNKQ